MTPLSSCTWHVTCSRDVVLLCRAHGWDDVHVPDVWSAGASTLPWWNERKHHSTSATLWHLEQVQRTRWEGVQDIQRLNTQTIWDHSASSVHHSLYQGIKVSVFINSNHCFHGPPDLELSHAIYCLASEMRRATEFRFFRWICPCPGNSLQTNFVILPPKMIGATQVTWCVWIVSVAQCSNTGGTRR